MGRTRPKKFKSESAHSQPPSIPSLIQKAEQLINQCDYELANRFITRIIDRDPSNVVAKEMLGVVQLETQDFQAAKQTFLSLLPPHVPVAVPAAHFYLAQLSDDDPRLALQHYQSGVDILSLQLKGKERANPVSDDETEIIANIVKGLLAQVEIWMDPSYSLCDESDAEKSCEELIERALQVDPGNPEALQTLASVRLSQSRPDDARQCLEQSWSSWKDLDLDNPKVPPISARISLVKLFLELGLFSPSLLVLHGIMSTDDEEIEAWYLEGLCYFLLLERAKENGGVFEEMSWEELAKESRDRLETYKKLHIAQEDPDAQRLDHVQEMIGQLEGMGIKYSPQTEEQDGSDPEWEDVSSEDEDVEMS